jgi:hypothetical protein
MDNEARFMRRGVAAALILVTVPVAAFVGCGGDQENRGSGEKVAAKPRTTALPSKTDAADPTDGRLTTEGGKIITDYGDRGDRIAAVQTLDQLQRDFRAGRMKAACAKVNDFLLTQFAPRGTTEDTPCPGKLSAYAAQRARDGDRPQRLRLRWVRSYTVQAGIWVDDARGDRLRIQMSSVPNAGWQFDLGAMNRPDILAARLVGADTYER